MQVQIVENWTDIVGEIRSYSPQSTVAGFASLEIAVTAVKSVERFPGIFYPNLLENVVNQRIQVNVPLALIDKMEISPGMVISCRIRRASLTSVFVHPEHLRISLH